MSLFFSASRVMAAIFVLGRRKPPEKYIGAEDERQVFIEFTLCFRRLVSHPACAQAVDAYPTKPVTLITPAAAGNSPDVAARIVADRLTQIWKQQVLILNRPGAGGLIAALAASTAEPTATPSI